MSHALRATSPPVASTTFATEDDETTTIRFALFETKSVRARARDASSAEHRASDGFVREDHACYVGGSVWALDWHSSERVFAVAARGEGHHAHAARAAGTCRGDVGAQIWRVRDEGGPEMEVMLLGNGGCVTDARWAPEVRSVDEDGDGDGDGALGRLAVSLGDSRVEVWTVPRWSPSTPRTRRANVSFAGVVPEDYGAPLCVDWNAAVPGRLAAGYSSGRVCVWDVDADAIEGASQRLHEDTQRFADGLDGCLVAVLDAAFTLVVFTPILVNLSSEITPPLDMGHLEGSWLWVTAFLSSLFGLAGAAFFGQKLVGLEVANQRVEALLRKDLVLLETTPAVIVGTDATTAMPEADATTMPVASRYQAFLPQTYFLQTLHSLKVNYFALFKHFGVLNFWLSLFDQCMVILPYVLAAPLIFAKNPDRRITLGLLVKMSNCFSHVFGSLSVVAENWGAINDFRSVLRRLSEFEQTLYAEARGANRLLTETASVQMTETRAVPPPPHPTPEDPQPPSVAPTETIPVVDGINPASEAQPTTPRRAPTPTTRGAGPSRLPIEIHVEHPPDFEDMRV